MTLNELIAAIQSRGTHYRDGGLHKTDIDAVLRALADVAALELQISDGEVPLPGIGKLVRDIAGARTGRNPATGAAIAIPARKVVRLRVAKALKDAVRDARLANSGCDFAARGHADGPA